MHGTQILAGTIFDNETGDFQTVRMEIARRINDNWKAEPEINSSFNTKASQLLHNFRNDDYGQLKASYFF